MKAVAETALYADGFRQAFISTVEVAGAVSLKAIEPLQLVT
jgi:hypothetical protein